MSSKLSASTRMEKKSISFSKDEGIGLSGVGVGGAGGPATRRKDKAKIDVSSFAAEQFKPEFYLRTIAPMNPPKQMITEQTFDIFSPTYEETLGATIRSLETGLLKSESEIRKTVTKNSSTLSDIQALLYPLGTQSQQDEISKLKTSICTILEEVGIDQTLPSSQPPSQPLPPNQTTQLSQTPTDIEDAALQTKQIITAFPSIKDVLPTDNTSRRFIMKSKILYLLPSMTSKQEAIIIIFSTLIILLEPEEQQRVCAVIRCCCDNNVDGGSTTAVLTAESSIKIVYDADHKSILLFPKDQLLTDKILSLFSSSSSGSSVSSSSSSLISSSITSLKTVVASTITKTKTTTPKTKSLLNSNVQLFNSIVEKQDDSSSLIDRCSELINKTLFSEALEILLKIPSSITKSKDFVEEKLLFYITYEMENNPLLPKERLREFIAIFSALKRREEGESLFMNILSKRIKVQEKDLFSCVLLCKDVLPLSTDFTRWIKMELLSLCSSVMVNDFASLAKWRTKFAFFYKEHSINILPLFDLISSSYVDGFYSAYFSKLFLDFLDSNSKGGKMVVALQEKNGGNLFLHPSSSEPVLVSEGMEMVWKRINGGGGGGDDRKMEIFGESCCWMEILAVRISSFFTDLFASSPYGFDQLFILNYFIPAVQSIFSNSSPLVGRIYMDLERTFMSLGTRLEEERLNITVMDSDVLMKELKAYSDDFVIRYNQLMVTEWKSKVYPSEWENLAPLLVLKVFQCLSELAFPSCFFVEGHLVLIDSMLELHSFSSVFLIDKGMEARNKIVDALNNGSFVTKDRVDKIVEKLRK